MWLTSSLLLGLFVARAQVTEPAAMVLSTTGADLVERGGGRPRRLQDMTLLFAGDQLRTTDKGDVLLLFLADGHRERVKAGTQATVEARVCVPREAVVAVEGAKLAAVSLASLRELSRNGRIGVVVVRSVDSSSLPHVTPLYGAGVTSEKPTLRWPAPTGAVHYLVEMLTDPENGERPQLLWQAQTHEARLVYPSREKPLVPGAAYQWRALPIRDGKRGPVLCESRFWVLPESQQQALAGLQPLLESGRPEDLYLVAALYEAHEVYDEALRLYERLAQKMPQNAGVLIKLAGYYELAGLDAAAAAARDRARKLRDTALK
jgi:hypothetical protein